MMKPEQTYQSWNDVVFEGRNKLYGAYLLRKIYDRNLMVSAVLAVGFFLLALSAPRILAYFKTEEVAASVESKKTIRYTDLAPPPPIDKNVPPPPKVNVPPPVKAVIKFLPPKVTDQEVPEEEEMPTIEEIKSNVTGAETIAGDADVVFDGPPVEVAPQETAAAPAEVFTVVEQMPEFEGGDAELLKWLAKNISYPHRAIRLQVEGTVMVSFVIDEKGQVADVQVVRGIGQGCDEEAVRVVSQMPAWKPGKMNGNAVRVRKIIPIKFQIANS